MRLYQAVNVHILFIQQYMHFRLGQGYSNCIQIWMHAIRSFWIQIQMLFSFRKKYMDAFQKYADMDTDALQMSMDT